MAANPRDIPRAGDELSLDIQSLAYGGEGVARLGRYVLFVDRAAPGERVRARVRRARRRHAEAEVVAVEQPSPHRIEPRCPHFSEGCGGCRWQHLRYEAQLEAKQQMVRDSLERIGGFRDLPMRPILPSPAPWYFRNKMEFAFHPDGGAGLHVRGAWDRIFRLETCYLESELAVQVVKAARAFAEERGIRLWDPRTKDGFWRELIVRQSRGTGETMVGIVTAPGLFPEAEAFAEQMMALDPSVVSIIRGIRSGVSDGSPIEATGVVRGRDHITEMLRGLRFRIGLETFFQTNSAQAEVLVDLVRDVAGPLDGVLALDVYCGVGVFSLALAGRARHVAGIEIVSASIDAARVNASENGVANVSFHVGDARTALPGVLATYGGPTVAVLDPPRAGAGGKVMRRIARSAPQRIVYVSCNPTTLARDLQELVPFGYRMTSVQAVDLFPQTYHVETVVGLERAPDAPPPELVGRPAPGAQE